MLAVVGPSMPIRHFIDRISKRVTRHVREYRGHPPFRRLPFGISYREDFLTKISVVSSIPQPSAEKPSAIALQNKSILYSDYSALTA